MPLTDIVRQASTRRHSARQQGHLRRRGQRASASRVTRPLAPAPSSSTTGARPDGRERRYAIAQLPRLGRGVQRARKPSVSSAALTAVPIPSATYWRTAPRRPSPTCARGSKSSTYRQARIDPARLPRNQRRYCARHRPPEGGRRNLRRHRRATQRRYDGTLQPPGAFDDPLPCVRTSGMLAALRSTSHASSISRRCRPRRCIGYRCRRRPVRCSPAGGGSRLSRYTTGRSPATTVRTVPVARPV